MDPIKIEKPMSKCKKNQFLSTLLLYSLTAFTCTLFCSSPLWFPTLFSSMKSFLFISLPKMKSFLFNPKSLFVVCNIIIVFLVGESKLVGSSPSPAPDIYDEYMKRSQSLRSLSSHEEKKDVKKSEMPLIIEETTKKVHEDEEEEEEEEERGEEEKREEESSEGENSFEGEEEPGLPADELKQKVEDFIAMVNRQRRLEAEQLVGCSS